MELSQSQYKKLISAYKTALINNIVEMPLNINSLRPFRNILYQIQKDQPLNGDDLLQQLIHISKLPDNQQKLILLRLLSGLPLKFKIKVIDIYENDLLNLMANEQYNFQYMSVINDILLSTYLLIKYNVELYGATINRILFLYTKMMDISISRQYTRNLMQVLRTLTYKLQEFPEDQLLNKLASSVQPKAEDVLNRILGFEARLRVRLLVGFCKLISRTKIITIEFITRLQDSIVQLISKVYECECVVDGILCICTLLWHIPHPSYMYNRLLRACAQSLVVVSFRRQYLQAIVQILTLSQAANNRLKYELSLRYIEISRHFQSQYTRMVIIKLCMRNLLQISKQKSGRIQTVLISLFHQKWFVTRLKQQNSLFREQFLICLITEYFEQGTQEVLDILDICHRLLDWSCNTKVQANVPTIKFTFDLYLTFLKDAYLKLGNTITSYLDQIIARINSQNINFLFKMKILTLLAGLLTYEHLTEQLKYDFIQGQLKPFMMPKHPKSIFTASYAQTSEGIIESSKEVQYIRNILNLLTILPNFYPQVASSIDDLIAEYRDYLTVLEALEDSNKELIAILLQLSDQPIITQVSRNLFLSIYQKQPQIPLKGWSNSWSYELMNIEEQSILPADSPAQLLVQPYNFQNGKFIFCLKTIQRIEVSAKIKISSGVQILQTQFQSGVHQIQISPIGILHFEVVSEAGSILGLGKYQIHINWGWKRIDWFIINDPIRLKVFWKRKGFSGTFLSIYWGQPLCIAIEENSTQLCICVCSRQIVDILTQDLQNILDELTNGKLALSI